ncbi:TIGR00366 family protein [Lachnoanaerobaculum sp. MSX33]|uniref:short-chain fatty acid transporter n=1 Tax=Lachnoanaerobaculum sp. MSX33 TaxID=936596 RepID=UPI0003DFA088|nr:short-chain fatty acid transporter [Lachnoanaerobaculum sp. MSX33]ETO97272.1 TIGR00366 family protein [Lachnoanaerobaculum sp. MSX33]
MFKKFTNACVNIVQKYLPDAFIFCIVLTILVFVAAMPVSKMNPFEIANAWGESMWSLLGFSMQMALVLVLGTALATAPLVKRAINAAAGVPKSPTSAIIFITVVSMIACWLNWGFGLVVGAILAKEIAKKVKGVDYRLLIASAYSGFVIWHAGFSGSIPLQLASYSEAIGTQTAGAVTESIPTSQTIFSAWNLIIVIAIIIVIAFVNAQMHPTPEDTVTVDPKLLVETETAKVTDKTATPAEWLERFPLLSILVAILAIVYLIYTYKTKGSITLSLNVVNLIFLTLGIIFHGTPISYVNAITDAAKSAGGIILQFPFYAGIMGIMTATGPTGQSLAGAISDFFVNISNQTTFPLFTFLSAGIVNFFVPSGGGQWAVQAPIVMPAGNALGVSPAVSAMAIAWGDAWTNMLQPFWALPALGIAGLGARDIMGYCAIVLIVTGIIIGCGFLFLVPFLA